MSPQFGHDTIPGTCNLKWVRRFLFAVLEVLLKGTAILPTSLKIYEGQIMLDSSNNEWCSSVLTNQKKDHFDQKI